MYVSESSHSTIYVKTVAPYTLITVVVVMIMKAYNQGFGFFYHRVFPDCLQETF